jgi:uncharacterized RDD family membrane protein YckC
MIDLSKSCLKCSHVQKDENKQLICGMTHKRVNFEDTCQLFEVNAALLERLENEIKPKIQFNYASSNVRLINYLIDMLAVIILELVIGVVILKLYGNNSGIYSYMHIDQVGLLVFVFLLNMIYYTLFESITGKTIGKYLTKSKVINLNGEQPGMASVLLRSLCRFVPFDQFSFLSSDHTGWHDTLSKTIVIKE